MNNLLLVLGILFVALFLLLPLLEKFSKPVDEKQSGKYSQIILVLMGLLILLSALRYFFGAF